MASLCPACKSPWKIRDMSAITFHKSIKDADDWKGHWKNTNFTIGRAMQTLSCCVSDRCTVSLSVPCFAARYWCVTAIAILDARDAFASPSVRHRRWISCSPHCLNAWKRSAGLPPWSVRNEEQDPARTHAAPHHGNED